MKHYLQIVLFGNYLIRHMTNPPHSILVFLKQCRFFLLTKKLYSQVASSFGTPSLAPSALLWFCSLIFFSCNFTSGTHVLQFCVPKSKEMWIVHIDISCNIATKTKRINQIHKNQFVQIIFTSIFWKPFLNFHPFLLLYNSLKLG